MEKQNNFQEVLDKVKQEVINPARREANKILQEATLAANQKIEEAKKIAEKEKAECQQQCDAILRKANAEVKKAVTAGETRLKTNILKICRAILKVKTEQHIIGSEAVIANIIATIAKNWKTPQQPLESIVIKCVDKEQFADLAQHLLSEIDQGLKTVELLQNPEMKGKIELHFGKENYHIEISGRAIENLMRPRLAPEILKIIDQKEIGDD